MRRRQLLAVAAGTLLAGPLSVPAKSNEGAPAIGFLGIASRASHTADLEGLRLGLEQLGYRPGRTIVILERYADGSMERFPRLLDQVLDSGVRIVVVPGLAAALAVRERAPELPAVAVGLPSTVIYPDLFASLQRPGGSVTGFSHFGEDLAEKRVELLRTAVPDLETVAILHNAIDPLYRSWGEKTEMAARQKGLQTIRLGLEAPSTDELGRLMASSRAAGASGLIVVRDFLTHTLQAEIIRVADDQRLATMAEQRSFVAAGGLMSYGASFPELFRRAAAYIDQILNGASPAEMPIQLATEFELVVNLQTAEALEIKIPRSILVRANEVIE
jgi:putative ABC transport system substrate-binding protein